jgi:hypothetical protein
MVPGEYAEIQSVHRQDTSPFIAEIEKDVTRTFPGNVFFGELLFTHLESPDSSYRW